MAVEDQPEHSLRLTVAERVEKQSDFELGSPPPAGRAAPIAVRDEAPLTEEEKKRIRKQRITTRLAGMEGRGMFDGPRRVPPRHLIRRQESEETAAAVPSPQHAVSSSHPPPPITRPNSLSITESSVSLAFGHQLDLSLLPWVELSPDDLKAVWTAVGVDLCRAATSLFEMSKTMPIGDGSYHGFVNTVFSQVPQALHPSSSGYGYLIYAQNGPTVSTHVSEIMPGDVAQLHDATFKGYKGLQSYRRNVRAGELLIGIICEFQVKKSKIKLFHANLHAGQQVRLCTRCSFFLRL
jgi:hypothetical protein